MDNPAPPEKPVREGTLRVAFATDDGRTFPSRHFGDSSFYDIYDMDGRTAAYAGRIPNSSGEETRHADPAKAQGVAGLLREKGVSVTAAKVYGPNLKRIRKKLTCLVFKDFSGGIPEALPLVQASIGLIREEGAKPGEERKALILPR